jgi:1D-myo-inositol-triphosphate 3-kinase
MFIGNFKSCDHEGFIIKLCSHSEYMCLKYLESDTLSDYVPKVSNLMKDVENSKKIFTEMQDLSYGFKNPSIMDIKIGTRTFLETEDVEKQPRNDLYLRMQKISPEDLTDDENRLQAITKRRFMLWRESSTSSSTLGFRIEAIKVQNFQKCYKCIVH